MKVLHVVNAASTGGAQTLIENLARVQSDDIRTTILVILGEDHLSQRFSEVADVVHLGMSTRTLRLDKIASAIRSVTLDLAADVLHSHLLQADLACLVSNRGRRTAHVSTVHTTGMSSADPLRSRLIGRAVGRGSRRFDKVVACSKSAIGYMNGMGYVDQNRVVIANGVPVAHELGTTERAARPASFVSLSRWHPMKDHATLFTAFKSVIARHPAARLICAGTGMSADNQALRLMVESAGIASAVDLLGPVDDVAPLLRRAAASVISSSYGEALPMAGLESISVGTPLVGTSVGEVPDLIVHPRLLARPADSASLASAMTYVLDMDDRGYATVRADSHAKALRDYDVRQSARLYRTLYESVSR